MLINKAVSLSADAGETKKELLFLLNSATLHAPVCSPECELHRDTGCDKNCGSAAELLSSEKGYPLEDKITPLVFEIKRMGVFEPCWSCEGHLGLDGKLWKLPMIWFYAKSMVHIRVLSDALKELHHNKTILNEWVIAVTHSDADNPSTCLSLRPERVLEAQDLTSLHQDIKNMEENLVGVVRSVAQKLVNKLN